MLNICCTQKLLRHLRRTVPADAGTPDTTTLGAWYANLVPLGRRKIVLFVNAATRLAIVTHVAPFDQLIDEFRERLALHLDDLGVHEDEIEREIQATGTVALARATDRSVIGTMNLIARELPYTYREPDMPDDTTDLSTEWQLNHQLQSPLGWLCPAEFVRQAFAEERPYVPPIDVARAHMTVEELMPHEWEFRYDRIDADVTEQFHLMLDVWERHHVSEAMSMLESMIRDYPEFIDAYHHLALICHGAGQHDIALDLWNRAVDIGLAALPKRFRFGQDLLRWDVLDNRPFHRASQGLALEYERRGGLETAADICRRLLATNPEDNQGVRALLVILYLKQGNNQFALELCEIFEDDTLVEIIYGHVLALFRLGRTDDALTQLARAAQARPLVARELAAIRHVKPSRYSTPIDDIVALGSEREADLFWLECGALWESTPGSLDFVSAYVATHPVKTASRVSRNDNVIPFPGTTPTDGE